MGLLKNIVRSFGIGATTGRLVRLLAPLLSKSLCRSLTIFRKILAKTALVCRCLHMSFLRFSLLIKSLLSRFGNPGVPGS